MKQNCAQDVWQHISVLDAEKCWPYGGARFKNGYGRFNMQNTSFCAHRVVYELIHGALELGLYVLHKCNNKLCCNPNHLTSGTNSENQRHASMSNAWKPGKSGIRGIGFDKRREYWTAQAYLFGRRLNLYTGPHKSKAIDARQRWESEHGIIF